MREARIWYSRDVNQTVLPGGFENQIVLSDEFFREVIAHSIPTDLEAAKALSSSPAALDLFMWLSYRCFTAKGQERVPIFGDFGLGNQFGSADYARPRKFRERLERMARPGSDIVADLSGSHLFRWPPHARSARRCISRAGSLDCVTFEMTVNAKKPSDYERKTRLRTADSGTVIEPVFNLPPMNSSVRSSSGRVFVP